VVNSFDETLKNISRELDQNTDNRLPSQEFSDELQIFL
jgi:hypothetical protein